GDDVRLGVGFVRISNAEARSFGLAHLIAKRVKSAPSKGIVDGTLSHVALRATRTARAKPSEPYAGFTVRWTLDLPGWRPSRDNDLIYRHWTTARRLKQRDVEVLRTAALVYGVPAAVTRRRVELTVYQARGSMPDDSAFLKALWDALADAEL